MNAEVHHSKFGVRYSAVRGCSTCLVPARPGYDMQGSLGILVKAVITMVL